MFVGEKRLFLTVNMEGSISVSKRTVVQSKVAWLK